MGVPYNRLLTFHEAWGAAKERADYYKPDWKRAQPQYEDDKRTLLNWLRLVLAPGTESHWDVPRPEPLI